MHTGERGHPLAPLAHLSRPPLLGHPFARLPPSASRSSESANVGGVSVFGNHGGTKDNKGCPLLTTAPVKDRRIGHRGGLTVLSDVRVITEFQYKR